MKTNVIHTGDSAEVLKSFPDGCIDLSVQSPPYDTLRNYKGFVAFDFETIARELFRVTKNGGVVVWVVGDETVDGSESGTSFRQALYFMQCGFKLHDTMIYKKNSPHPPNVRYWQEFEYMFILSKGSPSTFNPLMMSKKEASMQRQKRGYYSFTRQKEGDIVGLDKNGHDRMKSASEKTQRIRSNVWEYSVGGGVVTTDKIAYEHPAIFPEQLAADHIESWSNEGDIVLDVFAGSGTTLKMAKLLSRQYIGIEISQEYVSLAEKRLLATNVPLFGQGRGLTQREPDNGDSAPSQAFSTPDFLSDLEGLS